MCSIDTNILYASWGTLAHSLSSPPVKNLSQAYKLGSQFLLESLREYRSTRKGTGLEWWSAVLHGKARRAATPLSVKRNRQCRTQVSYEPFCVSDLSVSRRWRSERQMYRTEHVLTSAERCSR